MHKLTVEEMGRLDVEAFRQAAKLPIVLVLDNVRSLYNVGSMFRTADAFRIERICLCGITGCPPLQEIHKTALGAEDSVAWTYHKITLDAARLLRAEGYKLWAVEQVEGSLKLDAPGLVRPGEKYALILGNEVKGVAQEVVDMADAALEVPQYGTKHSFNVSVTAGIVLWELARRMGFVKKS